jgi:hypothetical protein
MRRITVDIAKLIGLLGLAILASCASTGPAERSYARHPTSREAVGSGGKLDSEAKGSL